LFAILLDSIYDGIHLIIICHLLDAIYYNICHLFAILLDSIYDGIHLIKNYGIHLLIEIT